MRMQASMTVAGMVPLIPTLRYEYYPFRIPRRLSIKEAFRMQVRGRVGYAPAVLVLLCPISLPWWGGPQQGWGSGCSCPPAGAAPHLCPCVGNSGRLLPAMSPSVPCTACHPPHCFYYPVPPAFAVGPHSTPYG